MQTNRRLLLACLPVALAPGASHAFRLEAAGAELASEYGAACPQVAVHDAIRAELESRIEGRQLPPAILAEVSELARCPYCGCGVAGAASHGEAGPQPRG